LSSISIDSSDTLRALAKLKGKAMGCDQISFKVLKSCATSLAEPVAALFEKKKKKKPFSLQLFLLNGKPN